jgi:hypothetical protein
MTNQPMTDFEMQLLTVLDRIARSVETIAMSNATEPAFVKPLASYRDFDWSSIGAIVTEQDRDGATVVEWGGYGWKRRNPSNNFGDAIFYTRPIGKKDDGSNAYARLITFKDLGKVKAINRDTEAVLEEKTTTRPAVVPPPFKPLPEPPRIERCQVCGQPFPLHDPNCTAFKREAAPDQKPAQPAPAQPSELDAYFPRAQQPALPIEQPSATWPANKAQFMDWLKSKKINGQETRAALGTDADSWLRMNQGRTWTDVAKTIASTLAK